MADELVGIVIVAAVSIVSIALTQFLTFITTRKQEILKIRTSYIQEQYRDLYSASTYLDKLSFGLDKEKNISAIQKILDERPYNFPFGFMVNWFKFEKKLRNEKSQKYVDALKDDLIALQHIYFIKYRKEVLGETNKELRQYAEALSAYSGERLLSAMND